MSRTKPNDETRLAEEIISVLPAESVMRVCSDDRDSIRYAVRTAGKRLRTVILSRLSLRRLQFDPARNIKLEYLQRDLLSSSNTRAEFRYPRVPRVAGGIPFVGLRAAR